MGDIKENTRSSTMAHMVYIAGYDARNVVRARKTSAAGYALILSASSKGLQRAPPKGTSKDRPYTGGRSLQNLGLGPLAASLLEIIGP